MFGTEDDLAAATAALDRLIEQRATLAVLRDVRPAWLSIIDGINPIG